MGSYLGNHLVRATICLTFLGLFYISTLTSTQTVSKRSSLDINLSTGLNKSEWHYIERRAAGTWKEAVESGTKYLEMLEANCGDSKATLPELEEDWSELEFHGQILVRKVSRRFLKHWDWTPRSETMLNLLIGFKIKTMATRAVYSNIMSPKQGFISCEYNFGPAYQILKREGPEKAKKVKLPEVSQLSDVLFLDWQKYAGKVSKLKKNLKYFIRYHIENPETRTIIEEATGHNVELYPGQNFPMTSDAGKALLGTPNGVGVAYFLSTHKKYLQYKKPKSVKVFKSIEDEAEWYNMIFFIDVEPSD